MPEQISAVERLQTAVSQFHTFLDSLPAAKKQPKVWGPREVLAHLVFWLETYVAQVEALLAGEEPPLPSGRYNVLNETAVAHSRSASVTSLQQRHRAACEYLLEIASRRNSDEIVFTLKEGSTHKQSLTWYFQAEARHIQHHLEKLQAQQQWDSTAAADELETAVSQFINRCRQQEPPIKMIAEMVFWLERWAEQSAAAKAKRPLPGVSGSLKKQRAWAVAALANQPVTSLTARLRAAADTLAGYGRTCDPQQIVIPRKLHHDRRTLDDIIRGAIDELNQLP